MSLGKFTGGRKPGSRNKVSRTVKETVLKSFLKMQDTKDFNFFEWGRRNPTEFYKICARLIPTEVQNHFTANVELYKVYKNIDTTKIIDVD